MFVGLGHVLPKLRWQHRLNMFAQLLLHLRLFPFPLSAAASGLGSFCGSAVWELVLHQQVVKLCGVLLG